VSNLVGIQPAVSRDDHPSEAQQGAMETAQTEEQAAPGTCINVDDDTDEYECCNHPEPTEAAQEIGRKAFALAARILNCFIGKKPVFVLTGKVAWLTTRDRPRGYGTFDVATAYAQADALPSLVQPTGIYMWHFSASRHHVARAQGPRGHTGPCWVEEMAMIWTANIPLHNAPMDLKKVVALIARLKKTNRTLGARQTVPGRMDVNKEKRQSSTTVVKIGLSSIVRPEFRDDVVACVENSARAFALWRVEATMLAEVYWRLRWGGDKLIHDDPPPIDQTFFAQCLRIAKTPIDLLQRIAAYDDAVEANDHEAVDGERRPVGPESPDLIRVFLHHLLPLRQANHPSPNWIPFMANQIAEIARQMATAFS
jgi:hypothetical protein